MAIGPQILRSLSSKDPDDMAEILERRIDQSLLDVAGAGRKSIRIALLRKEIPESVQERLLKHYINEGWSSVDFGKDNIISKSWIQLESR